MSVPITTTVPITLDVSGPTALQGSTQVSITGAANVHSLLTRYQVTTKTVKDTTTNQSHTFTYRYDEPATNDPCARVMHYTGY